MASSKLPVPAPMEVKGDPRSNWKFFSAQWSNYETATELEKKDDKIRVATLLSVMGKDCFQIYQNLQMTDGDRLKVTPILDALKKHFDPKTNVIYERYVFNTADQQPHENIDSYVTRIRTLSQSCEFKTLQNELIRDRIVLGTKDSGARSRMLREPELTLEKAIDMCRASEIAELQMSKLDVTEAAVNYTAKKKPNFPKARRQKAEERRAQPKKQQTACRYCGGFHTKSNCPAFGQTCAKCKGKNHFARVCLQTENTNKSVHVVETDSDDSVFVINTNNSKQWFVDVKMALGKHSKRLSCQVDTGASCNIMSQTELRRLTSGKDPVLAPTRTKLKQYDGATITPLGLCKIACTVGQQTETLDFLVVNLDKKDTTTLLSASASVKLGIITVNMVNKVVEVPDKPLQKETIFREYSDVFEGLGCLPGECTIEIDKTVKPVQHQPRKVPVAQKAEVKAEIKRLEKKGVIEKVTAPTEWISSMVVVRKPNKLRICLDPKDLNQAVKRSKYMMPTIDDILPKVANAKVFTVLDAKDGFWQVKLEKKSSYLTTFWTPEGRYRWLRLPFGISSAPEEFQRRQHEVLEGLEGADVIADDILVYGCGETTEAAIKDHDRTLLQVLERARTVGLKFNKDKMKLRQTEVSYMGHLLTSEGVRPDPQKVQAVLDMPKPTDVKGVQRFLGFVTYLSRFLPHLSEACEPLRRLTMKDSIWFWEAQQEEAFLTIKKLVTEQPVLRYYDLQEEVSIQCDASEVGLGATLLQKGQPVAFASRALTATEKQYAQIEKECLAIVFACEHFEHYIYGRSLVTVLTDHKPLEIIYKKPLLTAPKRLQRMLLRLQKYSLRIQYLKGKEMYIADTLSRASLQLQNTDMPDKEQVFSVADLKFQEELEAINFAEAVNISEPRLQQIRTHTHQDEALQTLKSVVLSGWPESKCEVPTLVREYWNFRDELSVQDGIIYKGSRVIVPKMLRSEMLTRIHSSHMGVESSLRKARDVLFWPNMQNEVKDYIQQCSTCNEYTCRQQKEPLMSHDVPDRPWSKVGVDIFTLQKSDYLVTVDYYSDFWELDLLQDTTSATIVSCLKGHFSRHGIPLTVISDNGPQLCSAEFNKFAQDWEFEHVTSSPYHSQSNGKAESAVKIAKGLVKKANRGKQDLWKTILDWRNTPTEAMDSSPAQRLMSRRTQSSLPTASELLKPKVVENVMEKIRIKRQRSKVQYDKSAKELPDLTIGQPIRMAPLPGDRDRRWRPGTCRDQHSSRSYVVEVNGKLYRRNRKFIRSTAEIGPSRVGANQTSVTCESVANPENMKLDEKSTEIPTASQANRDNTETNNSANDTLEPAVNDSHSGESIERTNEPNTTRSGRRVKTPSKYDDYDM